MTLDGAIAFFRAEQADLFRSTCDIKYDPVQTFDANTGAVLTTYTTRATGVPFLIRPRSSQQAQVGQEQVALGSHEGKCPADQEIEIDDIVEVTASTHDAALVGKTFTVTERLLDDWQICRRVLLELNEGT